MDPIRNPFVPGAGTPPPELTGRGEILERARILLERLRAGRAAKSLVVVGLRGVGKTLLLVRIQQIADALGYRTALIEAHESKSLAELLLPHLRRILLELDRQGALSTTVKTGLRVLKSFMSGLRIRYGDVELSLDIDPEVGAADSGDIEADLPELLAAVGRAARDRGGSVAFFLDELQYLSERDMSALIMALHRVSQQALPLTVVAAGLPQVVGLSGRSKSYAERLFDFPEAGALLAADATRALAVPAEQVGAHWQPAALDEIVIATRGYPYFLQEWGYHTWNTAPDPLITVADVIRATPLAVRRLDESFFRVRFDRLTPREKDYLRAMAELGPGPHRSGDIADRLSVTVERAGPLRGGLIGKGMIYSPAHGDTAFTVPLFDQFLRRIVPEWQPLIPQRRRRSIPE